MFACPEDALVDPFLYLPPQVEFTAEMREFTEHHERCEQSGTFDYRDYDHYLAVEAARFLRPKSSDLHAQRQRQFRQLKQEAESQGYSIPAAIVTLFTNDAVIDRIHHYCYRPTLPEKIVRLPEDPQFALFLFLIEGQACGIWHLLLGPDGSHTVVCVDDTFGCPSSYPLPPPDESKFNVFQCMDSVNRFLYHYFVQSAQYDTIYLERLRRLHGSI